MPSFKDNRHIQESTPKRESVPTTMATPRFNAKAESSGGHGFATNRLLRHKEWSFHDREPLWTLTRLPTPKKCRPRSKKTFPMKETPPEATTPALIAG